MRDTSAGSRRKAVPNFVEAKCANICIVLSLEFRVEIVDVFNRSELNSIGPWSYA